MIVCVAVVGHQNNPLYIQSFTDADDALKLHHIVHCSLDVIEERVNNPKKSGTTLNEAFLGLLYPTVNYKVYGYLTNTKVKFILVTTDLDVRDTDVRSFFRKFHAAYVDAVSNPFHVPGKKITSRTFAQTVSNIVGSYAVDSCFAGYDVPIVGVFYGSGLVRIDARRGKLQKSSSFDTDKVLSQNRDVYLQ